MMLAILTLFTLIEVTSSEIDNINIKLYKFLESKLPSFQTPYIDIRKASESKLFLDVRGRNEFETSHIEGAVFVDHKNLQVDQLVKKYKGKKVIVYCSVGYRSGMLADKLRGKGVDAYNLKGGVFAWSNSGRTLINQDGATVRWVHPYDKNWSKWAKFPAPLKK